MDAEFTRLSSRGQVVIPQGIRDELGLREGTPFAVSARDNLIILRAMEAPNIEKEWEQLFKWGTEYAKKKGFKPDDVQKAIDKRRG